MQRYYFDESGHDGDLVSASDLGFSGQPMFALAGIGIEDDAALIEELERLRTTHRCGIGELKSSGLGAKLPAFASDLTRWLIANRAAIFVELVEKRYFLAIHIVNHLLCGPYSLDEVDQPTRRQMAELLHGPTFDKVLLGYLAACRSQSLADIKTLLDLMWSTLDESDEDIARSAQLLTMYARDNAMEADADAEAFLPIADESVTGKKVWMLPNLQCLTNIYGRINQSRRDALDGVTFVHDVQLQYGKVLDDAKRALEALAAQNAMPFVPFADYQLRGHATLAFATSEAEPCLQAADILAGCAMRFGRSGVQRKTKLDPALREAVLEIYEAADPYRATGINFVIGDRTLDRLAVPHLGDFSWLVRSGR